MVAELAGDGLGRMREMNKTRSDNYCKVVMNSWYFIHNSPRRLRELTGSPLHLVVYYKLTLHQLKTAS